MPRSVRVALIAVAWLAVSAGRHRMPRRPITGVVRDTSGAVLPGVTVEVASPALIEKVRSVVTDDAGQYRVENLRPGTYTVTITLPGFSTVRRDGVELTGTFTASVNAEMRVGAVEETITVTGESPIVDVQSTARQQVLDAEIINALPSGRNAATLAGFLPGRLDFRVGSRAGCWAKARGRPAPSPRTATPRSGRWSTACRSRRAPDRATPAPATSPPTRKWPWTSAASPPNRRKAASA